MTGSNKTITGSNWLAALLSRADLGAAEDLGAAKSALNFWALWFEFQILQ